MTRASDKADKNTQNYSYRDYSNLKGEVWNVIIIGYLAAVILKILPTHGQCSAAAVWIAGLLWIGVFFMKAMLRL